MNKFKNYLYMQHFYSYFGSLKMVFPRHVTKLPVLLRGIGSVLFKTCLCRTFNLLLNFCYRYIYTLVQTICQEKSLELELLKTLNIIYYIYNIFNQIALQQNNGNLYAFL